MKEKCPRCNGTGKEQMYPNMICGLCNGDGIVTEEYCPRCLHPKRMHESYRNMGIVSCECESSSGAFICGCQGSEKTAKPICNVCGGDFGNCYCLNRHLGESENCLKNFKITYY